MGYARCAQCGRLYEEEVLLERENDGRRVCPACSGLLAGEDLDCRYDETG